MISITLVLNIRSFRLSVQDELPNKFHHLKLCLWWQLGVKTHGSSVLQWLDKGNLIILTPLQ